MSNGRDRSSRIDPTRIRKLLERLPIPLRHGVPIEGDPRVLAILHARRWITRLCGPDRLAITRRGREALDKLTRGRAPRE